MRFFFDGISPTISRELISVGNLIFLDFILSTFISTKWETISIPGSTSLTPAKTSLSLILARFVKLEDAKALIDKTHERERVTIFNIFIIILKVIYQLLL